MISDRPATYVFLEPYILVMTQKRQDDAFEVLVCFCHIYNSCETYDRPLIKIFPIVAAHFININLGQVKTLEI